MILTAPTIWSLLAFGVFAAGLRLIVDILLHGRPRSMRGPHTEPPMGPAEIAEEGRMRAAHTDITYTHYNAEVRRYAND